MDRAAALAWLESEGLYVVEWTDAPLVGYPPHAHPDRQVCYVLEGSMVVGTDAGETTLGPGQHIELRPDERHWARSGADGVRYLAGSASRP